MVSFAYRCTQCSATYGREEVSTLCPVCVTKQRPGQPLAGVLEAVFDYAAIAKRFDPARPDWSLFCAVEERYHPPYPAGGTPLHPAPRLGGELGFKNLLVKNDGLNPSGSLKDRASFLVVAEAARLKETRIVAASTGNAGTALAAVCAAAGMEAIVFVPERAPRAKLISLINYGATLYRVKGTYDDAFRLSIEYTKTRGGINRNTAYHPLTIEGKKTAAFEIFLQLGHAPDVVVVPVGDGVILAAIHKGFRDLRETGVIDRLPRLLCVQAKKSDAIHRLVATGVFSPSPGAPTVADSISVSVPSNAWMAARAIKESGGFSVTVSDTEILDGQKQLAATTGVFAEPAAAAVVAGLKKAAGAEEVDRPLDNKDEIVLLVTGHGLKDIHSAGKWLVLPDPIEPDLSLFDDDRGGPGGHGRGLRKEGKR
jgi:threonine synthase